MAVIQKLETLYELAVKAALDAFGEISGTYTVRVADEIGVNEIRPVILVKAVSMEDATAGVYDGYDIARVEIMCISDKTDDPSSTVVNLMIGAVRDAWAEASINSDLELGGGLKIFGTSNEGEGFRSDDGDKRVRMLPVTVTGSSIHDVP